MLRHPRAVVCGDGATEPGVGTAVGQPGAGGGGMCVYRLPLIPLVPLFKTTKLILLDSLGDLYNFTCHVTTTDRIVMKFWILPFQWQSSILYFWSQAYGPPELVVNVL